MEQLSRPERRREPRHPVSFPVWWKQAGDAAVRHGWMLDLSAHGAALLTPRHSRPAAGDSLSVSLIGPQTSVDSRVSRLLLERAAVCRVDSVAPTLERVALHFERSLWNRDETVDFREIAAMLESQATCSTV